MSTASQPAFHYEVHESRDGEGVVTTTIICHGQLVSGGTTELRELIKPLIERGGQIVIDCGDLNRMDSSGLGALVGLKVSSVHKGFCSLGLVNLSAPIKELLRITKLTEYLARPDSIRY